MNRRDLFKVAGGLLLGTHFLKPRIIPDSTKNWTFDTTAYRPFITDAIGFLSTQYRHHAQLGLYPHTMFVSRAMLEQYESELTHLQRFVYHDSEAVGEPTLAFKAAKVCIDPTFRDFQCRVMSKAPHVHPDSKAVLG